MKNDRLQDLILGAVHAYSTAAPDRDITELPEHAEIQVRVSIYKCAYDVVAVDDAGKVVETLQPETAIDLST